MAEMTMFPQIQPKARTPKRWWPPSPAGRSSRRWPRLRPHAAACRHRPLRLDLLPRRPGRDRGDQRRRLHARDAASRRRRALSHIGLHRFARARRRRPPARQARRLPLGLARHAAALRRHPRPRQGRTRRQHHHRRRRDRRHGLRAGRRRRTRRRAVRSGLQLALEYAPAPPFNSGRPETAPPEVLAEVEARMAALLPKRLAETQAAAATMKLFAGQCGAGIGAR